MAMCAAFGCKSNVATGKLMCAGHWQRVPWNLQEDVYRTWHAYRLASIKTPNEEFRRCRNEYLTAVKAAREALK